MPLVTTARIPIRRHALLVGTAMYQPGWGDIAAGVNDELERLSTLLLTLGYAAENIKKLPNPGRDLIDKVAEWSSSIAPSDDDWLLLYYSGHGVRRADGLHLITSATLPSSVRAAPTAQALLSAFVGVDNPQRHALLILDTCESAAADQKLSALAAAIRDDAGGPARGADFNVIYTARAIGKAIVTHFVRHLARVVETGSAAGPEDEYLHLTTLVEHVDGLLEAEGAQRARTASSTEKSPRFFANPQWRPRFRVSMDHEARARTLEYVQRTALRDHWDPRARGVSKPETSGWFFTGRSNAFKEIHRWLATQGANRGRIVRGIAGSGKSAFLARFVTLADVDYRMRAERAGALDDIESDSLPTSGVVDAAVHARKKDGEQIALEIAAALRVELAPTQSDAEQALLAALKDRTGSTLIVVDALDEANDSLGCAGFLKRIVADCPRVRLVVGVRESAGGSVAFSQELGAAFTSDAFPPIDVDDQRWHAAGDLAQYVASYLRGCAGSPYEGLPLAAVRDIAAGVAERAGTSFLIASITANALASREKIVGSDELGPWPDGLGEALALDLDRFKGVRRQEVECILIALACAEGATVPKDVWRTLSEVISSRAVDARSFDSRRGDVSFYVIADANDTGFRLYHQAVAAYLRRSVNRETEAAIADTLLASVPRDADRNVRWRDASQYVLEWFPKHLLRASRADELSSLISDPEWMQAKRERWPDIGPLLADIDLAIGAARADGSIPRVVRACAVYAQFVDMAPPIVIDVLARLGQRARATLMAENIEYPLDRCHAFALLAGRYAAAGDRDGARRLLSESHQARGRLEFPFDTMAEYWVVRAAIEAGFDEMLHVSILRTNVLVATGGWEPTNKSDATAARRFGLANWEFWAAMCYREAGDRRGLAEVRELLATGIRDGAFFSPGMNLVLQTAAVTEFREHLRALQPGGVAKPGNLALALVDAGMIDEFERLEQTGANGEWQPDDALKRYAWALGLRGRFDAALAALERIDFNLEERARGLWRLAQIASAAANSSALSAIADAAVRVRHISIASPNEPRNRVEPWRVESWLAPVMLACGRPGLARELCESVCDANITPSRETSLAVATPSTARAKAHLEVVDVPEDFDEYTERILAYAAEDGVDEALSRARRPNVPARARAFALSRLAVAVEERDAARVWLEAIVAGRSAGLSTIRAVTAGRDMILSAAGTTSAALLAEIDAVQQAFQQRAELA